MKLTAAKPDAAQNEDKATAATEATKAAFEGSKVAAEKADDKSHADAKFLHEYAAEAHRDAKKLVEDGNKDSATEHDKQITMHVALAKSHDEKNIDEVLAGLKSAGVEVKASAVSVKKDFLQCRASAAPLSPAKDWAMGEEAVFCYMPAGITSIVAGFRDKAISITVEVDEDTAKTVQASFENIIAESPKQKPFGDIEHKEEEASFHPKRFFWGEHSGDAGVMVAAEPTALGVRNVNGKIHRSFSPTFSTDAELDKAVERGGVYTFPEGVRGSTSNPARITGIDFCVGTLTNKPAFRNMPAVKAKQATINACSEPVAVSDDFKPDYEGIAKRAELKSKIAASHDEIYPDGEQHGSKHEAHMQAMDAHMSAAWATEDEKLKKLHEAKRDEHKVQVDKHRKVIASFKVATSASVITAKQEPVTEPIKTLTSADVLAGLVSARSENLKRDSKTILAELAKSGRPQPDSKQ